MNKYLFLISLFFAEKSIACTCSENLDVHVKDNKAQYVFIGKLDSKHRFRSFFKNKYKFSNLKMYKGVETDKLAAWSYKSSTSCGVDLKNNMSYLVFAYKNDGNLWIDRCSTWLIDEDNSYEIEAIKQFYLDKVSGQCDQWNQSN